MDRNCTDYFSYAKEVVEETRGAKFWKVYVDKLLEA
jgi:hypothetical protein